MKGASLPVERELAHAGGLTWQFRQCGVDRPGLPLVLLHPSPRSSAMYTAWLPALAEHGPVYAIDTPGYGGTDPLPTPPQSLADYVAPLHALLHHIAGPRALIYGSATGAQIGIAYALRQPRAVAHLVLDNAAHFTPAQRTALLEHYFPDLVPRTDGSHLTTAWRMAAATQEYFPWFEANEAHRIAPGPALPAAVHAGLCELLGAGPEWTLAYRAAFEHEDAAKVMALEVPTTVLRWQASILLPYIDQLLAHPLPPNVVRLDVPAQADARFQTLNQHLSSLR
ncbi:MAG: alpha/beta hydrolase [Betaproteobacteria bacterium]|nr:alpha/beta hydrolase [Betaproteobacteria bacterium]